MARRILRSARNRRLAIFASAIGVLFVLTTAIASAARPPVSFAANGKPTLDGVAVWSAPAVDVPALLSQDDANWGKPGVPLRIGFKMPIDIMPDRLGTWEMLPGGDRLWRLRIDNHDALWTVLGFDSFRLQDGGVLWIYDATGTTILGPFTTADVKDHGELWTPPIEGHDIVLELLWPAKMGDADPRFHLGTISHGYKPFGSIGREAWNASRAPGAIGDSGSCNIDVNCPLGANWQDEKRGAVILLTSGGSDFCSGSLINNTANNCKPYILTAAHCTAGASTAYGFNFERTGCGTGNPGPANTFTVAGGTVRGNFASSDFTLIEMSALPPESFNFYLNGWSHDPLPATENWVIHHPSGDVKKISYDDDPPVDGTNWGPNHWRVQQYEQGTTEPGSSGSPLFNQNGLITGQLHGGTASCSSITYDEYGKVSASWTGGGIPAQRLSDWLDPIGNGALTWPGLNGSSCFFQPAGVVSANRSTYSCADTIAIHVRDDSLQGQPSLTVSVTSNTETQPVTVTLNAAAPNSGNFDGTLVLTNAAPTAGAPLSVSNGDTVTITYIDANDGAGGTNVPRTTTATVDCAGPVITNVQSSNVTGNSARITWDTNEAADSRVRYGVSTPPGSTTFAAPLGLAHTVNLTGLTECSTYYYSVESADAVANLAVDNNAGGYYTFETIKNTNPSFLSADTPIPIPDNLATGATSTINVPDTQTVLEVKVRVNITHTYDGDLALSLIAPNNTSVSLANRRGTSGDNFTNTLFDDAAATSITAGAAPFTGSFRPETPLSAVTGNPANGAWKLKVVDNAGVDVGTIDNWTLILRYPAAACGPHAKYSAKTLVADACSGGGPGAGNGTWDAGETVDFRVSVENDGTTTLTNVSATVTATTAGVTMAIGSATYPSIPTGGIAASNTPFRAVLPASLACGTTVGFNIQVNSDQGSWTTPVAPQSIGTVNPGNATALDESFSGGIPGTWTVVDGGTGGGAAATWTTGNPGGRTATAPITTPFAIVDSDNAGQTSTSDEQLITPVLNLSTATSVTLEYDNYFRRFSDEKGDVDVRSSLTGGAWVNVVSNTTGSTADPEHKTVNITAAAAGAADVQIRFRYYNAVYEWWWMVDNVKVTYVAPAGCNMNACVGGPAAPPPVPDGTFGQAMRSSRSVPNGSSIALTWDVGTCTGADYHVLYGSLSSVSSYAVSGAGCNLGTSGAATWAGVPAVDLWYVVVSDDNVSVEGSWGRNSSGQQRNGSGASGQCAVASRNNAGTCP